MAGQRGLVAKGVQRTGGHPHYVGQGERRSCHGRRRQGAELQAAWGCHSFREKLKVPRTQLSGLDQARSVSSLEAEPCMLHVPRAPEPSLPFPPLLHGTLGKAHAGIYFSPFFFFFLNNFMEVQ